MADMLGPYLLGPNDTPENGTYTGDARKLAKAIPDESVDLIFTDPPYLRQYLWTYDMLARLGARVLKPGCHLFVYAAGEHLPASLAGMEETGLQYFWTFVLLHRGGWPRMWHKHLMSGYKPVLVYTKGDAELKPWMGTVHAVSMDKRYHIWGQGAGFPTKMMDMLTSPGAIVLDPFTGGGTVPAVCKMLGRRYLAFEIDPDVADIARERVRNTQMPLFVLESHQMTLGGD